MMASRINLDNQTAVVLHHFPYKNNSLIVHFFLPAQGKVSAIARGVRQSKKNEMSQMQPFQELQVSLQGKGELLYLKGVDSVSRVWKLKGKALYCAYYLNELLLRLLPAHTDCRDIFYLYAETLALIIQAPPADACLPDNKTTVTSGKKSTKSPGLEIPLRYFELKLLEFLGYGLNFAVDVDTGETVQADKRYYFDINAGPSLKQHRHGLAVLSPLRGQTLLNLSRFKFDDEQTLQESKQLLKYALSSHLGPKPLKSRKMFRQLYG